MKFSYFEPTFTEEFIIGYNNGIVEILNPSWEKEKIKIMFDEKYGFDKKKGKLQLFAVAIDASPVIKLELTAKDFPTIIEV